MRLGKPSLFVRRLGDARRGPRARPHSRGEDGFILLESIVAISLITVIMAALATFTINAVNVTGEQRARQAAAQLATAEMSKLRSFPASEVVAGRTQAAVQLQIEAGTKNTALEPFLRSMTNGFYDETPTPGAETNFPTSDIDPITLNKVDYTVTTYLGECTVAKGSPDCVKVATGITYVRAVVAVTWPDPDCPPVISVRTCTYVTSTLLNKDDDPIFNVGQTVATAPVPVNPGAQTSTVGASVAVQLDVRSGTGVPTYTWAPTDTAPLPAGLALSASGLVSGYPTAVAAAKTVTVTVTDSFGRTGSMSFTWRVVAAPTVAKPNAQSSIQGQAATLAVVSTCPNGPCTFTLAGAPPGLTINPTTGTISGTPTTPGAFANVIVTITDSDNVAVASGPFTWTVVPGPTIGAPGTLTATIGSAKSVPLAYTCPGPPCTLTLTGTGTNILGMGLALTPATTTNNATTLDVTAASGTVYIGGTVQATAVTSPATSRVYTPAVKITNKASGANVTSPSGSWTIFVKPTIGAVNDRTVTVGAAKNVSVAYTCPNVSCTLTLANPVPGLGLSTVNGATAPNSATTLTVANATGTVYINGKVDASAVPTGTTKSYAVSLTIKDADNATAVSSGTWTASTAPNIVNPGSQAVEIDQNVRLQMTAACPNGGCTWTARAQLPGTTAWTNIPISTTGLITYNLAGLNAPSGVYTVEVTATDSDTIADIVTFPLTIQNFSLNISNRTTARPSSGTTEVTINVAAAMSPLADGYIYTMTGQPSWLTISAAGVITATITPTTPRPTTNTINVTVRSVASSTSFVTDPFTWSIP